MQEVIIFDLGGVLIDWNPRYLYRKIFLTEESIDNFLSNICTSEWNEMQDAGRSFEEGTRVVKGQFPEYYTEIQCFYDRWEEMLGGSIDEMVEHLYWVKENTDCRIIALTNWSKESFPIALKKFDFLSLFEVILVSGEEGIAKPNPKIYELLLERYGIKRQNALFIDDNLRNVEAALAVGLPSYHHKDVAATIHFVKQQFTT